MNTTWILVADSSKADFYAAKGLDGQLQLVLSLSHDIGRAHASNLTTDLPGSHSDKSGAGRHSLDERTDPKELELIHFVKEINNRLNTGRINHLFDRLVIVAAPHLLGIIRQLMDPHTAKLITHEIGKHLTHLAPKELAEYVFETQ